MSRRPAGRYAPQLGRAPHCLCGRYAPPYRSASLWNEDEETIASPIECQGETLRGQSTAPAGRSELPAPLAAGCSLKTSQDDTSSREGQSTAPAGRSRPPSTLAAGCSLDSPCYIPAHPTPELAGLPTPTRGLGRVSLGRPARPLRAASPRPRPRYRRPSRSPCALSWAFPAAHPREDYVSARCAFAPRLSLRGSGVRHTLRLGIAPVVARRWCVRGSAALRSKRCRAACWALRSPARPRSSLFVRTLRAALPACSQGARGRRACAAAGSPAPLPRRVALPPAQKL